MYKNIFRPMVFPEGLTVRGKTKHIPMSFLQHYNTQNSYTHYPYKIPMYIKDKLSLQGKL